MEMSAAVGCTDFDKTVPRKELILQIIESITNKQVEELLLPVLRNAMLNQVRYFTSKYVVFKYWFYCFSWEIVFFF